MITGFQWAGFFLGSLFLLIVGIVDDKKHLSPFVKLIAQIIAAVILLLLGFQFDFLKEFFILNIIFTMLWVIFLINAFNLLDNVDGQAVGISAICSFMYLLIALYQGEKEIAFFAGIFMVSNIGFLFWNFHPSKLFMGDAGSMFLGYTHAVLSLSATYYKFNIDYVGHLQSYGFLVYIFTPLFIYAVPIYDVASVVLIRILRRQPIYIGDLRHFSHRMIYLGMNTRFAVSCIYLITLCSGISGVLLMQLNIFGVGLVVLEGLGMLVIGILFEYFARRKIKYLELRHHHKVGDV